MGSVFMINVYLCWVVVVIDKVDVLVVIAQAHMM